MKTTFQILSALTFSAALAFAGPIRIDFTALPGADNVLGTADDLAAPSRISADYAFFAGGVGFTVDSLCCSGTQGNRLAAITTLNGVNVLAQARPDIDDTAFSFGSLAFNMVNSADGTTPTIVTSIDVRFAPGATGTLDFFNSRSDLRVRFTVPHSGTNANNFLYSDADGLSRVVFTGTGAINLFEFDATAPLQAPPEQTPAPEPSTLAIAGAGLLLVVVSSSSGARKILPLVSGSGSRRVRPTI